MADVVSISYSKAALVGVFQSLSIIPGVSRAGATIVGGLALGLSRSTIVEISFLLAVPTMIAATGYDLLKNVSLFESAQFKFLGVGFLSSFVVAILSIKFLLAYISTGIVLPVRCFQRTRCAPRSACGPAAA